ncbi:SDR family NAD(P)-dependent oxidoreductase [Kribbella sp. NPDC056345]|uniref:SDR family NAD(P)-dependent oxidoreductase n=1 Tax=Kribbella sp. NPDC056345 TaxID=3345789 RepID=UPI0035DEF866
MSTAVITGATNGLGRLVALDLARQGFRLGIVARSPEKADSVMQEIQTVAPGTRTKAFVADLTSVREVARAGREIAEYYPAIDVLINNAGLHAFSARVTADGVDEMTAVNYLAPWVLTNSLLGTVTGRVVTVASQAALQAGSIDPGRDLTRTDEYTRRGSMARYGRTKLMDIMFSEELVRRLAGTGVVSNCCDPGFNTSGIGRELPFAKPLARILNTFRIGDPRRGAGIITRLATDPAIGDGYFSVKNAARLECPEAGRSAAVQRELWEATAELIGNLGR